MSLFDQRNPWLCKSRRSWAVVLPGAVDQGALLVMFDDQPAGGIAGAGLVLVAAGPGSAAGGAGAASGPAAWSADWLVAAGAGAGMGGRTGGAAG